MSRDIKWLYFLMTVKSLVILGTCSYVVFWMGRSPWWFLLAVMLLPSFKDEKKDDL